MKPITKSVDLINRTVMKVMKLMTTGITEWIWKIIKRPYDKCKQNLHLQRNIFWLLNSLRRCLRLS